MGNGLGEIRAKSGGKVGKIWDRYLEHVGQMKTRGNSWKVWEVRIQLVALW